MLRGENIACGTSTTGSGTLTLAATPASVGAIDSHAWLTSKGYVNGGVHLTPYKVIEFTDSTFATPKQMEQGIGTYTLGASISADTLARTTVLSTQVVSGPTYTDTSASALTIGTAANVLVFFGPGALDIVQCNPYFETGLGDAKGILPMHGSAGGTANCGLSATTDEWFIPFTLAKPLQVKRGSIYVATATGGGTSSAFFRLYEVGSNGRPGRLLFDYGALGGANPLNGTGWISTALAATGVFLTPAMDYFASIFFTYSTGSPALAGLTTGGYINSGLLGTNTTNGSNVLARSTSGNSTAPDPANSTGYDPKNQDFTFANATPMIALNNA